MRMFPTYSTKCCIEPLAIAMEHMCFLPELQREYCKLFRRTQSLLTKNKRILALSEPKWHHDKFRSPCFCPEVGLRKVEIVREELWPHTRTEQLAYPPVGRLLELRERDSFQYFSDERKSAVNRLLRKSMVSVYSRLASLNLPTKPAKPNKLSETENEAHIERLKKLAKPKYTREDDAASKTKSAQPTKTAKGSKLQGLTREGPTLRRFKSLARPKLRYSDAPQEWHLTNAARMFTPSKRLLEMARPRSQPYFDPESAYRISTAALHYRATDRIKLLANPSTFYQKAETKEAPFATNPRALRAKASKRITELAEPNIREDGQIRAHPYRVSRKALRAKLTPRLIELAQPRYNVYI